MSKTKGEKSSMLSTEFDRRNRFVYDPKPFPIRLLNRILSSQFFVFVIAALACLAFTFSKEFEFYVFVIVYGLYIGLFADDLSPLMPLFPICYVVPSSSNNPGHTTDSVFYGKSGMFLLVFVLVAVGLIFIRIFSDHNMGVKKFFFRGRFLSFGLLLLGAAYMLSGIQWDRYAEFAERNLIFASLQFLSVFLLYFVFTATVDWNKFKVSYLVCVGIAVGLVVSYELVWLYINGGVIVDGAINRSAIETGWGIRNNIGAMITMAIPFPFYFAAKKLFPMPWILLGTAFFVAAIFSCSRASSLCAIGIFGLSYLILLFTAKNKFSVYFVTAIGVIAVIVLAIVYYDVIIKLFSNIMRIYEVVDGEVVFNDQDRLKNYKSGIKAFLDEPIFGKTFYPTDAEIYDAATLDSFSSFFPPRWHNTVIQLLASCGIVGLAAYAIHRISTVIVLIKRKNYVNVAIGLSMLSLLLMSLLDCHFFNIGPTLFYSIMLAVAECGREKDD
ncbi:MAG: O-antigen ligase family protein [Ruminococcaceae bacterium]|nr:O-antigen ligase family protein [Oscillospiraceae bacterium]